MQSFLVISDVTMLHADGKSFTNGTILKDVISGSHETTDNLLLSQALWTERKVRDTRRQRNASMKVTVTYDYNGSRIAVELFYCQRFYSPWHVSSSSSFAMNPIWPGIWTVQQVTQWNKPPFIPFCDTLNDLCIFSDSSHFIFVSALDCFTWGGEKEANASHNE